MRINPQTLPVAWAGKPQTLGRPGGAAAEPTGPALPRLDRGPQPLSQRMRLQLEQLKAGAKTEAPASLADAVEGSLDEVQGTLTSMEKLAEQALAIGDEYHPDREAINNEYQRMLNEIDGIARNTTFGGQRAFQTSDEAAGKLQLSSDEAEQYVTGLEQAVAGAATDEERQALGQAYTEDFAAKLSSNPDRKPVSGGYAVELGADSASLLPVLDRKSLGLEDTNLLSTDAAKQARGAIGGAQRQVERVRWEYRSLLGRFEDATRPRSENEQVWADQIAALDASDNEAKGALLSFQTALNVRPEQGGRLHGGLAAASTARLLTQ